MQTVEKGTFNGKNFLLSVIFILRSTVKAMLILILKVFPSVLGSTRQNCSDAPDFVSEDGTSGADIGNYSPKEG